ncbi:hypothetical protein [Succinimonas amylolytica]|uniref:hypothetical protein n=1 Tax=Succinimonas amylolytica TaxID=83769 RepID=UPI0012F9F1F1|nr:hypothetical protein [Succinimonas amylolytica]
MILQYRSRFAAIPILTNPEYEPPRAIIAQGGIDSHTTEEFICRAVVFQEEYYETHPHERYSSSMTESECAREAEKFKQMMIRRQYFDE